MPEIETGEDVLDVMRTGGASHGEDGTEFWEGFQSGIKRFARQGRSTPEEVSGQAWLSVHDHADYVARAWCKAGPAGVAVATFSRLCKEFKDYRHYKTEMPIGNIIDLTGPEFYTAIGKIFSIGDEVVREIEREPDKPAAA